MASISILVPTRNRPEFLLEALASVARQTHSELELILARDGGDPFPLAIHEAIARLEFPTQIVEHDGPPEGAAVTRNNGLTRARGDAVALLDDDDYWEPNHAAALSAALDHDPDADVVYSDVRIVRLDTDASRRIARDFDLGVFVRDGFIPTTSMAARRDAFARFGMFDPEFTLSEDWEWLIRVAKAGGRIRRVRGESAVVRIHDGGISSLSAEHLAKRRAVLDRLAERYSLAPIVPKTFWEVAASV